MLYTETVEPGTLSLLKKLMSIPELADFSLVGGTALSLQYGHRTSIDLDLFSTKSFDYFSITTALQNTFGNSFEFENKESSFGIFCFINSIKVDIIKYKHLQIDNAIVEDNIRMYSSIDIAAMKVQAILGRGKKKDFWDLAELLTHYSLEEIISFYSKKYPSQQLLISIPQAVTYFDDAEESEDPVSLKGQTWESVKKIIQQKVNDYLK
jgi:hypothetical protein